MNKPTVALLTIAESRDEFYQKRKSVLTEQCELFTKLFSEQFAILSSDPIKTAETALYWADEAKKMQADAVIIHVPVWASPNLATKIAANTDVPVAILGNLLPASSSFGCLLAVGGAMGQIGKKAKRIVGDMNDIKIKQEILSFVNACSTVNKLKRSNYCIFGGRSLGIVTTQADFSAWAKIFGVECDHKDQYEIIRDAELTDEKRTQKYLDWLNANLGLLDFGGRFTLDSLKRQINCYIAVKDIAAKNKYDFISIKCQQEMSDSYVNQCLVISMLNDNYDADGFKKPIPCACEGDNDGALTMKILSDIGGGLPTSLMDIRLINEETHEIILANCGGAATYFAGGSSDPKKNLKNVYMMEHVFGEAGGGAVQYVASEGPVTLARLFRVDNKYIMGLIEGEYVYKDREELRKTTYCYPHGFVNANIDFNKFTQTIGANHMHVVSGHHKDALKDFCEILDIDYIDYNC